MTHNDGRQVAVVTGTSSGIGLHVAVGLAHKGMHVVATMRDTAKADRLRAEAKAQGVDLTVRSLDVTDHGAARRCLDEVAAEFGPVDILVNNAGRATLGTLEQLDDAALQEQLDVNYLGAAALTRHVLPSMREAGAGRVISVSSDGGTHGQPFLDGYCAAKFALEGLMQSLEPVAARFGVVVSVVEPGSVLTDMTQNMDASALAASDNPYGPLQEKFVAFATGAMDVGQSPQDAAAVVIEAATTDEPRFRWQTSEAAVASAGLSLADLDGSNVATTLASWLD